jgi:FkbM family methyltransferase
MLASLKDHVRRLSYQLGRPFEVGSTQYKARGYFSNPFVLRATHEQYLVPPMTRVLAARTGAFIDVGVNVGQTLLKLLSIDKARAYIGFEPQIACCFYVTQFLRENGIENAKVLPIALSDANLTLKLYSSGNTDEMATTVGEIANENARSRVTLVPARVGDEVVRELGLADIALIKIDVEGAELSVLQGLRGTLRQHHPSVLFEVLPNFHGPQRTPHPDALRAHNRERAAAIFAFFSDCGYAVHQIDGQGNEARIQRFELDDPAHFIGGDYIAHWQPN